MNVHGLNSLKGKDEQPKDEETPEFYSGGNDNRGGGRFSEIFYFSINPFFPFLFFSGLAVYGNDGEEDADPNDPMGSIVGQAMRQGPLGSSEMVAEESYKITLFQNGFVLNDGEFRDMADPTNASFLQEMSRGYVPRELREKHPGKELDISVEDKRGDVFTPPPYSAFGGEGNTIGF